MSNPEFFCRDEATIQCLLGRTGKLNQADFGCSSCYHEINNAPKSITYFQLPKLNRSLSTQKHIHKALKSAVSPKFTRFTKLSCFYSVITMQCIDFCAWSCAPQLCPNFTPTLLTSWTGRSPLWDSLRVLVAEMLHAHFLPLDILPLS